MPAPHWKPPRPLKKSVSGRTSSTARPFESTRRIRQSHSVVARIRSLYFLWQTQAELLIHLINHREAATRAKLTTRKRKSGVNALSQLTTNVDVCQDEMQWQLLRYQCIVNKKKWPRRKHCVRKRDSAQHGHGDHTNKHNQRNRR